MNISILRIINLAFEQHRFLTAKQGEHQTIEQYITELKTLSLSCEFGTLRDSLVRDVRTYGLKSENLREKLLQADHNGRGFESGESWVVEMMVEEHPIKIKLETGAMANAMPKKYLKNMDFDFKRFGHLLKGIGCLERPYKIELKENAEPVIHATRTVPFAIRNDLKKALDKLEEDGLIEKAPESAKWVHPLVIVRKKTGQLRLCIDPRDLNLQVKRHYLKLPTLETLTEEMAGCKLFSTLDCTQGFLQIPLDKESAKICTFSTIFGRYRFLRLPYGLTSAPEVFQEHMQEMFGDIQGVKFFIDDLCIFSVDQKDHDKKLKLVLERAEQFNLRFNAQKCKFGRSLWGLKSQQRV